MRPPSRPWLLAAGVRTEAGGALVYALWWLGDGDGGVATPASCSLYTHSPATGESGEGDTVVVLAYNGKYIFYTLVINSLIKFFLIL